MAFADKPQLFFSAKASKFKVTKEALNKSNLRAVDIFHNISLQPQILTANTWTIGNKIFIFSVDLRSRIVLQRPIVVLNNHKRTINVTPIADIRRITNHIMCGASTAPTNNHLLTKHDMNQSHFVQNLNPSNHG